MSSRRRQYPTGDARSTSGAHANQGQVAAGFAAGNGVAAPLGGSQPQQLSHSAQSLHVPFVSATTAVQPPVQQMANMSLTNGDPGYAPTSPMPQPHSFPAQPPTQFTQQNLSMTNGTYAQSLPYTQVQNAALLNPASQCPKEFLRMTVNVMPQTVDLLNKSNLPLGAIIQPLAEPKEKPVR